MGRQTVGNCDVHGIEGDVMGAMRTLSNEGWRVGKRLRRSGEEGHGMENGMKMGLHARIDSDG